MIDKARELIHRFGSAVDKTPSIKTVTLHYDSAGGGWSSLVNGQVLAQSVGLATAIEAAADTFLAHGSLKVDGREHVQTKMRRIIGDKT